MSSTHSLLNTVSDAIQSYEAHKERQAAEYVRIIATKEELLENQRELIARKEEDMQEFLKVSFASRWKKKSETLEASLQALQEKYDKLADSNGKLNHILDIETEKKIQIRHVGTQTPNIEIQTKKTTYTLEHDRLVTSQGDEVGTTLPLTV